MTLERTRTVSERERLARLRAAWQADNPSKLEVERARIRWLTRSGVSPMRRGPRALLVAAAVFGTAAALAATGAVTWPSANTAPPVAHDTIASPPATQPRPAAPRSTAAPRSIAAPSSTAARSTAAPHSTAGVADTPERRDWLAPAAPTPAAASGGDPAVKSRGHSVSRLAVPNDAPKAPVPRSAGGPLSVQSSGAWQRAADALRHGDDQRASHALGELSSSSDPYTRDTAALAKAQLDAAAGRWEQALPVLRQLAAQGATPLLRRRANEMLGQAP